MHALNKLRRELDDVPVVEAADVVTRDELDEFREEFRLQFAEAFQALAAAVGIEAPGEGDELEDLGELDEAPEPAPDVHEEGRELVEKIHERKSRKAKTGPEEGAQPLDGLEG